MSSRPIGSRRLATAGSGWPPDSICAEGETGQAFSGCRSMVEQLAITIRLLLVGAFQIPTAPAIAQQQCGLG